uniref:BHLH domain-containing protein n=1 Tax=Leptobrachium leishanense TaxID=445787 RepID=A0A8C5PAM6_9ANUR
MEGTVTGGEGHHHEWSRSDSSSTTRRKEQDGRVSNVGTRPPSTWKIKRQKGRNARCDFPSPEADKANPAKQSSGNAAKERTRVKTLRQAFLSLQAALPTVPPDTKLSKLDVLILATSYIAHLTQTLDQDGHRPDSSQLGRSPGFLHPMKKWPMRVRLYAGALEAEMSARCASGRDQVGMKC